MYKKLAGKHRSTAANKALGRSLAFIAGAINAGGFIAVKQYTSHMTGILSLAADNIVLKDWFSLMSMLTYILCFILGAATTVVLVISGRKKHLHSQYALPLSLEAFLLIIFGIINSNYIKNNGVNFSYIAGLLCYLMGLQNAVVTKISNMTIRTTHVTGMVTDIGIEVGRFLSSLRNKNKIYVNPSKEKISLHLSIVFMFFLGGVAGAYGFKYIGFLSVIPLAGYLLFIAYYPIKRDMVLKTYLDSRVSRKA